MDALAGNSGPLHADQIEPCQVSTVAHGGAKWDDIAFDAGHATNKGVMPNPTELVNARATAKNDVITDLTMPRDHRVVGKNHAIADDAVMSDVGIGKKCAIVANLRHRATALCARIHCYAFTDGAIAPHFKRNPLTVEFQVLRFIANRRKWKDPRLVTDFRNALHRYVAEQPHTVTKNHFRSNMAKRTDLHVGAKYAAVFDDC